MTGSTSAARRTPTEPARYQIDDASRAASLRDATDTDGEFHFRDTAKHGVIEITLQLAKADREALMPITDATPTDQIAVVHRYFDGCQAGKVEEIRATLAPDVTHYFLGDDRPPIHGSEHLARFWAKMKRVLDVNWSVDHELAHGTEVVVEWTLYWTHPDTGARLVNRGTDWYVLEDDLIREVRAYFHFPATPPLIGRDSQLLGFPYRERGYP